MSEGVKTRKMSEKKPQTAQVSASKADSKENLTEEKLSSTFDTMSEELRELTVQLRLVSEETAKVSKTVNKVQDSQNAMSTSVNKILKQLQPLSDQINQLGEKVSDTINKSHDGNKVLVKSECLLLKESVLQNLDVHNTKAQETSAETYASIKSLIEQGKREREERIANWNQRREDERREREEHRSKMDSLLAESIKSRETMQTRFDLFLDRFDRFLEDRHDDRSYPRQQDASDVSLREQSSYISSQKSEVSQIADSVRVLQVSEGEHFQLLKDGIADTYRAVTENKTTILETSRITQGELADIKDVSTTCTRKVQVNTKALNDSEDRLVEVATKVSQVKSKLHEVSENVTSQIEVMNRSMDIKFQKVSDHQRDIRDDFQDLESHIKECHTNSDTQVTDESLNVGLGRVVCELKADNKNTCKELTINIHNDLESSLSKLRNDIKTPPDEDQTSVKRLVNTDTNHLNMTGIQSPLDETVYQTLVPGKQMQVPYIDVSKPPPSVFGVQRATTQPMPINHASYGDSRPTAETGRYQERPLPTLFQPSEVPRQPEVSSMHRDIDRLPFARSTSTGNDNRFTSTPIQPVFNGEGWKGFITKFEIWCEQARIKPEDKGSRFLLSMIGKANDFISEIPSSFVRNFEVLKDQFKQKFENTIQPVTARSMIGNVQQEVGEDLDTFASRINRLIDIGYPSLSNMDRNNLGLEVFLKGCGDGLHAYMAFMKEPKNIREAVDYIKRAYSCKHLIPNKSGNLRSPKFDMAVNKVNKVGPSTPSSSPPRSMTSSPGSSKDQCYRCGGIGHYARECASSKVSPRNIRCFNCGELGHIKRECTAPRKNKTKRVYTSSPKHSPRSNNHSGLTADSDMQWRAKSTNSEDLIEFHQPPEVSRKSVSFGEQETPGVGDSPLE